MSDIFDQIHAEATGGSAPAPTGGGDIFDQIHAQSQPAPGSQPLQGFSPSQYFQKHPGMDPLAVEQAYNQLQGRGAIPQAVTPEQARTANQGADSFMQGAGNAIGRSVAQPIQGMMGAWNPQLGQAIQQNIDLAYGQPQGAGGFVGRQVGNAVNLPYMMTPVGRVMSAAGAAGNERIDIQNQRDQGAQIGGAEELARSAGMGALDYGTNVLLNKFGGQIFKGMAPTVGQTATQIAGAYAKKFGQDALTNEALVHAGIAASNLIAGRPITEGMGAGSIADAVVQTAGQLGLHALAPHTPVPQENIPHENVPERPVAPVEAKPPVQEPRPAEDPKPEAPVEAAKTEGTQPVQPEPQRAKTLPELPAEAGQWSHKQLKSWAEDAGFDTEGANGKLKLRNKITDQLLSQEKALRRTDPLTEAPNKIKYDEDAASIFKDADTKKEHTAVVETDIGNLKVMNTIYGHEGGDEMLKLAHQAMREELRVPEQRGGRAPDYAGSAAYRVGGDEFPMILRNVDSPAKTQAVMDRVNKNFDAKIAAKFPDLDPNMRPFIAHNAEIRAPGDTRPIDQIRATADKGVEAVKSKIKAERNIPEGRTALLEAHQKYQAEKAGKQQTIGDILRGNPAAKNLSPETLNAPVHFTDRSGAEAAYQQAETLGEHGLEPVPSHIDVSPSLKGADLVEAVAHEAAHHERNLRGREFGKESYNPELKTFVTEAPLSRDDPRYNEQVHEQSANRLAKLARAHAEQQEQPKSDFFERIKAKGAEIGKRLVTEEEGGAPAEASRTFARRTLAPAIQRTVEGINTTLGNISRAVGTGLTWTLRDRDAADNLSRNLAEHAQHVAQLEEKLKPSREIMSKWTDSQKDAWANQVEATGTATDPKTQDAADISRHENEQNIKDGKKYGLRTDKWEGDYLGRLAKFEGKPDGNGVRSKLAGSENFLKGRSFDTYGEFADFVRSHGGEMVHDNPADTLLAKQAEIRRSIAARKSMYEAEDRGDLHWVPDKEKAPEGFDAKLKDPLSQQDRSVIAPKWMVGKLAKMTHFEAQRYMEGPEWAKNTQTLREGDKLPDGMTHTGQTQSGEYRGNANVADQFNNLISPGLNKSLPVLKQVASVVRAGTNMALNLSGAHYFITTLRSASGAVGRSLEALHDKDWSRAAQNAWLVNPLTAFRLGAKGLEEYRAPGTHPELSSQVQGAVEGGARPQMKSALNPDHFAKMQREWNAGNPIESAHQLVRGLFSALNVPLHEHFVPKIKFAANMMNAAAADAKGLTGTERSRYLSRGTDVADNSLGQVVRDRQFQNKIVSDTMDLLMTAPKFFEGDLRSLGSAGRDVVQSLRDLGSGKKPELTPAMYHAAGMLLTQVVLANMVQLGLTAYHGHPRLCSSLSDILKPQTGGTDADGNPERVFIPTATGALAGFMQHPIDSIGNRISGVWKTAYHEFKGADENNVELSGAENRTKYAAKNLSPYSVQNVMNSDKPGKPSGFLRKAAESLGARFSYPSGSDAEEEIYSHMAHDVRTPEEAEKSKLVSNLAGRMRQNDPKVDEDIDKAIDAGKLNNNDYKTIVKRSQGTSKLAGLLNAEEMHKHPERYDSAWDKMTPSEKEEHADQVYKIVSHSKIMDPDKRDALLEKINKETTKMAGVQ